MPHVAPFLAVTFGDGYRSPHMALFLFVVVIALLIVVPPLAWMEQRMTDAAIDECLLKIRMHK